MIGSCSGSHYNQPSDYPHNIVLLSRKAEREKKSQCKGSIGPEDVQTIRAPLVRTGNDKHPCSTGGIPVQHGIWLESNCKGGALFVCTNDHSCSEPRSSTSRLRGEPTWVRIMATRQHPAWLQGITPDCHEVWMVASSSGKGLDIPFIKHATLCSTRAPSEMSDLY